MEHDEHGAAPEQVDEGFGTGGERQAEPPEQEREPNFARGHTADDDPAAKHKGRFSEGEEELPDSPEKNVEGRYSRGIEESPTSE
jgi:hypothetical protein